MSDTANYEDIYEEIFRISVSPSQYPVEVKQYESPHSEIRSDKSDYFPDANSILQVLTPPSAQQDDKWLELLEGEIDIFLKEYNTFENSTNEPTSESEYSENCSSGYSSGSMCDSSEMSGGSSNIVIPNPGSSCSQGKQMQMDNNSSNQNFANQQGQQNAGGATLSQILGHCGNGNGSGVEGQGQHPHSQQPQQLPQIHHQQQQQHSHFQNHLQQQSNIMDNHHHNIPQQMNLAHQPQQHSNLNHGQSHAAHFPHGPTSQQFMPYGMHLNTGSFNNGGTFPFHPHSLSNQPPGISHPMMGMNPMQACFMQHAACMQQLQQQQQQSLNTNYGNGNSSRERGNNNYGSAGAVGWMTGPLGPPGQPLNLNTGSNYGNRGSTSCAPSANVVPVPMTKSTSTLQTSGGVLESTVLPGGLEVLWRELPLDCQKLMVAQDVPETARFRGYFTVCELLQLKRALEERYLNYNKLSNGAPISPIPNAPIKNTYAAATAEAPPAPAKEEGKRGTKRGRENKEQKSPATKSGRWSLKQTSRNQSNGRKEATAKQDQEDDGNNQEGELMLNLDSIKQEPVELSYPPAVTGVGVVAAVKAAMETLSAENSGGGNVGEKNKKRCDKGSSNEAEKKGNDDTAQVASSVPDSEQCVSTEVSHVAAEVEIETEIMEQHKTGNYAVNSTTSGYTSSKGKDISRLLTPEIQEVSSMNANEEDSKLGERQGECDFQPQMSANPNPLLNVGVNMMDIAASSAAHMVRNNYCPPMENRFQMASPPYRTATLVLRLLRIGQYNIKTFSTVNPNRLRVLFNSQRLTYECQLPIAISPPSEGCPMQQPQPMRKVLTIDIGFDQIRELRFGQDYLLLRVEGPPLLTVAFNPASQEEVDCPNLTPENEYLLEQIEKGQLKLSPIHEIFFLNERLVQLLESQLREHPKFRHLF